MSERAKGSAGGGRVADTEAGGGETATQLVELCADVGVPRLATVRPLARRERERVSVRCGARELAGRREGVGVE